MKIYEALRNPTLWDSLLRIFALLKDNLQTQNEQDIQIKDSMVKFGDLEVPVLFSETHYGEDWEKVKILCIKRPLTDASFEFHDDEVGKYFMSFHPKIEIFCIHVFC